MADATRKTPECAGAVQPYAALVVVRVAEAAGSSRDVLGQPVRTLGSGVGDPGGQERLDRWSPGLDGVGEPDRFGDVGVHAPGVKWATRSKPSAARRRFSLLLSSDKQPAALSIFSFFGQYGTVAYGQLAAFSILYSVPVISLYVFVSRVLGGSSALAGAVKG